MLGRVFSLDPTVRQLSSPIFMRCDHLGHALDEYTVYVQHNLRLHPLCRSARCSEDSVCLSDVTTHLDSFEDDGGLHQVICGACEKE